MLEHLSFEAYALYNAQRLGNTAQFDWSGSNSPTHITAYNCALRFSGDPIYLKECLNALQHYKKSDGTVFFSLVPDALVIAAGR